MMKKRMKNEKNRKPSLIDTWNSLVLAYRSFSRKPSGKLAIKLVLMLLRTFFQILLKKIWTSILF